METFPRGITKETPEGILNGTPREILEGTPGDNLEVTCWEGIWKRTPGDMPEGTYVRISEKRTRVEFLEQTTKKNPSENYGRN